MVKFGIIESGKKDLYQWPGVFDGHWQQVERYGKTYLRIHSFEQYFIKDVPFQLDAVFDSQEAFDNWYNSDIGYIDKNWRGEYTDYKQAREKIKSLVQAKGFDLLSPEEKQVAASWFVLPAEQIKEIFPSLDERLANGAEFDRESVISRTARWTKAKNLLYTVLHDADGTKVMGTIMQRQFEALYTKMGQEGTMKKNYKGEFDNPGLFDFLMSTPQGIAEFGYGLLELGLTPLEGYTPESLRDRLIDILDNGNY